MAEGYCRVHLVKYLLCFVTSYNVSSTSKFFQTPIAFLSMCNACLAEPVAFQKMCSSFDKKLCLLQYSDYLVPAAKQQDQQTTKAGERTFVNAVDS